VSYGKPEPCLKPRCPRTVGRSKFERIRAGSEGWFFPREGGAWCPDHLPEWVPAWRERQKKRKDQG